MRDKALAQSRSTYTAQVRALLFFRSDCVSSDSSTLCVLQAITMYMVLLGALMVLLYFIIAYELPQYIIAVLTSPPKKE